MCKGGLVKGLFSETVARIVINQNLPWNSQRYCPVTTSAVFTAEEKLVG
jgi:hypothetical protein